MPITKPAKNASSYKPAPAVRKKPVKPVSEDDVAAEAFTEDSENRRAKVGTTVQDGWASAKALLDTETEFENRDFKPSEDKQLIKFLEEIPLATYQQHWINEAKGKKSHVCLDDDDSKDNECPLCDIAGDKPRGKFAFNILNFSMDDGPTVQVLTAPPSLFRLIDKANEDAKHGPIDKEYYELSRLGEGPKTQYKLDLIRTRDLEEEWGFTPDEAIELVAGAVLFTTDDVIRKTPRAELLELARSLVRE